MKNRSLSFHYILLAAAIGMSIAFSSCSDPLSGDATPRTKVARLDAMMAMWEKDNAAMGAVAFTKGGKVLYQNYTGFARRSDNTVTKADSTTIYQVASMTKMFTSVMIHQLIDEGRLQLSTKLSEFYPQIKNAENITIRHLLEHRSGLHNWSIDADLASWSFSPQTREQMLARFATYTPEFTPDEKRYYSNTNYSLLGYIIETVTRSTYAEQLRMRIADRIGLKNTYDGTTTLPARPTEAQSFTRNLLPASWQLAPKTHISTLLGTGSVFSTPVDICRFLEALFAGQLTSQQSLRSMITPNSEQKGDLGKGIDKETLFGGTLETHTKSARIDGFTGQAFYFPADSTACVVILNGFTRTNIVFEPARLYYGK